MDPVTLKQRGFMCSVPGCNKPGLVCTIDCFDSEGEWEGEASVHLCEKHFDEARSAGQ
jgi:hypothetical protein